MKIDPIATQNDTLDNAVYIRLKEMIVNKQLETGVPLIQSQLCEVLGVSRTPVRKAIGQLETEGLLRRTPRGWYVQEFTVDDMVSVFEIRAVLEGLACRFATPKLRESHLAYMRALFKESYEAYVNSNDRDSYYQADLTFHTYIVELASDNLLQRTINSYHIVATSMVQGLYRDPHDTYSEHLQIIDAFTTGKAGLAENLMREHVRKAIPLIRAGKIHIPK